VDDRVFIHVQLRKGDRVVLRSKVREFAALAKSMATLLKEVLDARMEAADTVEASGPVVLECVDANTEQVLVRFRTEEAERVQVIEGCFPLAYQKRLLDPGEASVSASKWMNDVGELDEDQTRDLAARIERAPSNLIDLIRKNMDQEGRFVVRIPVDR
jgi:hypothetical protein